MRRLKPLLRTSESPGALAVAVAILVWFIDPAMTAGQDVLPPDDTGIDAASETAEMADDADEPVIPVAYPEDRYLAVWQKSPFMLEAAPEPAQAQKSFARDYFLVGYVESKAETVIYLKNQKTGESVRVPPIAKKEGAPEFKLIELKKDSDPREVKATISLAGETAEIGRDPAAFSQPASPGMIAQGGATGDNPNQPAIPGQPIRNASGGMVDPQMQNPRSGNPATPVNAANQGNPNQPAQGAEATGPYVNPAAERLRQQQAAAAAKAAGLPPDSRALPANPAGRRRIILPTPAQ